MPKTIRSSRLSWQYWKQRVNNPFTFPFFYYGSYKVGTFLLGHDIPGGLQYNDLKILMTVGRDVAVAMVAGGVLLGILPAIGTYFLTLHLFRKIRARRSLGRSPVAYCSPGCMGFKESGCAPEDEGEDLKKVINQ
jgi:hypothetical protein